MERQDTKRDVIVNMITENNNLKDTIKRRDNEIQALKNDIVKLETRFEVLQDLHSVEISQKDEEIETLREQVQALNIRLGKHSFTVEREGVQFMRVTCDNIPDLDYEIQANDRMIDWLMTKGDCFRVSQRIDDPTENELQIKLEGFKDKLLVHRLIMGGYGNGNLHSSIKIGFNDNDCRNMKFSNLDFFGEDKKGSFDVHDFNANGAFVVAYPPK